MVKQMNFLGLVVKDVAKATEFYTETLGFEVDEQASIPNAYTQFALKGDAIMGLLAGFEKEGIEQSFDTGILVEDVDAAYTHLQNVNVETISKPQDMPFGRTFLFRTPDGHVLRLYTPLSAS